MAFPEGFVDEVRRTADIVRVVSDHVALKKLGASWKGLCPFHKEKTPSFHVRAEPAVFHCFGCGEGGDVFKFVMLHERCSFPEAVEILARRSGLRVPDRRSEMGPEQQEREQLLALLEAAAQHFTRLLWSAPGTSAREYLLGRGFRKETLERIRAGAARDAWDDVAGALGRSFPPELLLTAGLQVPGKDNKRPYDRFRGRALFPILNEGGRVVGFGARSLDGSEPKYLNSPETPVYQKGRLVYGLSWAREAIRQSGQVVLMEGYLDVARALEHGVGEVVATCGTALTPAHARLLRRFAPRVVLNFDQDAAGQKAAERSYEALAGEGFDVRVVELPEGHDPDTYLRDHGPEAYRERLGAARPYLEWLVLRAAAAHDTRTPTGKAGYFDALAPALMKVDNAVERAAWLNLVADRGGLDRSATAAELRRRLAGRPALPPEPERPVSRPVTRRAALVPAEKWLLTQVVLGGDGTLEALLELDEGDVAGLYSAEALLAARRLAQAGRPFGAETLAAELESEGLRALVTELAVRPVPTGDAAPGDCVKEIKRRPLEARMEEIQRRLGQAQADEVDQLLKEKLELRRRIEALSRPAA